IKFPFWKSILIVNKKNSIGVKQMKMKNVLKVGIGVLLFLLLGLVSWKIFIDPIDGDDLTEEEANDIAKERFNGEILDTKLVDDIYHMTIKLDTGEYELKIASKSGEMMDLVRTKEETPKKDLAKNDNKKSSDNNKSNESKKSDEEKAKKEAEKKEETQYQKTIKIKTGEYKIKIASKSGEMMDLVRTKEETPKKDLAKNDNKKSSDNNKSNESKKSDEEKAKKEAEKKEETQQEEEEPPKNITSEEAIQIALDTVYGEVDDVDLEDEDGQLYYFIEIETEDDLEAEIQIHAISGEVISIEWDD